MTILDLPTTTFIRDLGDGLILRQATPADADALAAFNSVIHSDEGPGIPDPHVDAWTRDLLTRPHPTLAPGDFTIVEDTRTGAIVSSLNLIPQTWAYEGIPFGVGRPEAVGTAPEYRRRGLVRAQFEVIHQWSAERGHLVQAITGIPYYYRQFGYEMALDLAGRRGGYAPHVPKLKDGESEPYSVRPASPADLAFIAAVYEQSVAAREPITCVRDEAIWRYELDGRSEQNMNNFLLRVIESAEGERVGFLLHAGRVWKGSAGVRLTTIGFELMLGVSWLAVTPSVVRYLWQTGEAYAAARGLALQRFTFGLGAEHPAYEALADRLPAVHPPYAWYLRVPDVPGFVRHIAPALEQRLANSIAVGHTGVLELNFYRGGLRLVFERGRLVESEPWQCATADGGMAGFPALTFLQLLFGYRSLAELRAAFPDCFVEGDAPRVLLNALFPKRSSGVWGVG